MLAVPQVAAMTTLCAIKDTPGGASCSVMGTGHPYPADGQKAGSTHTSEPYTSQYLCFSHNRKIFVQPTAAVPGACFMFS